MGESPNQPFQLSFNASLKIDFQGSLVTSDGGLILVRDFDERLGFGELIQQHLTDSRRGKNTQFPFAALLDKSVAGNWNLHQKAYVWALANPNISAAISNMVDEQQVRENLAPARS